MKGRGILQKIEQIKKELTNIILDREEFIDGLFLGLLTGQHVLLIGPPGTAKSMLVNEFGARLTGGNSFFYLMTKFTKPDEIIGPVSLKSLENDDFRRVLEGRIADAHFVFLDEIFNSNSSCANTILTILNERRYYNGSEVVEVPLVMMVGATNELSAETTEELQAFYDRFLFRYEADYVRDVENLRRLFDLPGQSSFSTCYSLEDLVQWQKAMSTVEVPADIVNKVISIVIKLREAGINISDRRFKEARKVLQACAFIKGKETVSLEELDVLRDIFWIKPADKKVVGEVLYTVKLTIEVQAAEILKEAQQIWEKFVSLDDKGRKQVLGGEINVRLVQIEDRLRELKEIAGIPGKVLTEAAKKVDEIHSAVIEECLGLT
jgi:MoxR-like ATPase